jgi:hypothetical protein
VFRAHAGASPPPSNAAAARATVGYALKTKDANRPEVYAALAVVTGDIARQVSDFGAIMAVPAAATTNVRNDMYLASDAVRVMGARPPGFGDADLAALKSLRSSLDSGTKFIPIWVKVSVALALGLGTMVGWKRIVVTVGEKIGKTHLTYGRAPAPRSWRWRRSAWRTCSIGRHRAGALIAVGVLPLAAPLRRSGFRRAVGVRRGSRQALVTRPSIIYMTMACHPEESIECPLTAGFAHGLKCRTTRCSQRL